MFRIGEFLQIVRVSPRMLRHYEKCGLFYLAEIDKVNEYHLYSASQIPLLFRIISLKEMGFLISEMTFLLLEPKICVNLFKVNSYDAQAIRRYLIRHTS